MALPIDSTALAQFDVADALGQQAQQALDAARRHTIADADGYSAAAQIASQVKGVESTLEKLIKPIVDDAFAVHKSLVAKRDLILNPLKAARDDLNRRALSWRQEETRREQAAQAERERIAREAADAERRRLEAERLEQAIAAEKAGDAELAEELVAAPVYVPDPPVIATRSTIPQVKGASVSTVVSFEIVDAALLPREFCAPCETVIRAHVKAHGMGTKIPGVRVYEEQRMSNRGS